MATTTARAADRGAVGAKPIAARPSLVPEAHRVRMKGSSAPNSHACWRRPEGQVAAADAVGETEVVADQRAGPRLSAHRLLFHHHRRQPFGRGVHGGGEAGRTGPDDRHVEEALGRRRCRHAVGHLGVVRLDEHLTIEQHEDREPAGIEVQLAEDGGTLRRVGGVEQVRHAVAFQPVTDGLRPGPTSALRPPGPRPGRSVPLGASRGAPRSRSGGRPRPAGGAA